MANAIQWWPNWRPYQRTTTITTKTVQKNEKARQSIHRTLDRKHLQPSWSCFLPFIILRRISSLTKLIHILAHEKHPNKVGTRRRKRIDWWKYKISSQASVGRCCGCVRLVGEGKHGPKHFGCADVRPTQQTMIMMSAWSWSKKQQTSNGGPFCCDVQRRKPPQHHRTGPYGP